MREIHPQQNTAQETFDGISRKNEECIHNCQHQKELSLVRKDIGCMALELDGLKHSMGNLMQQMQQVMETLMVCLFVGLGNENETYVYLAKCNLGMRIKCVSLPQFRNKE